MVMPDNGLSLTDAAKRVGVAPATLRRWLREGLIPQHNSNGWSTTAIGQARVVARMRDRGHSLQSIRKASEEGRLAYAYADELFPETDHQYTIKEAARESGLEPALIERIITAIGFPARAESVSEQDLQLLRYASAALEAGFPLVAMLQVIRVYGQAIAQVADAEVRLFHLYVHEPLMRSGSSELEVAEQMEDLSKVLLPLASPVLDQIHQRYLQHFIEQDIVGHMESDLDGAAADLGRIRVAIAFADLTGYTRLTEEEGELEALDALERFVEAVEATLPDTARVVKLIGDEVMIVGSDPSALIDWAVGFTQLMSERPVPRIGLHYGEALYRDGDYYGRDVNIASRIAERSGGGEVLVTRPVVEQAGPHLEFDRIGEIKLKGFSEPTEMFLARAREDGD
jgi:adenylate cyclase